MVLKFPAGTCIVRETIAFDEAGNLISGKVEHAETGAVWTFESGLPTLGPDGDVPTIFEWQAQRPIDGVR